jgi:hypothetical protein
VSKVIIFGSSGRGLIPAVGVTKFSLHRHIQASKQSILGYSLQRVEDKC